VNKVKIGVTAICAALGLALTPAAMGQNPFRSVSSTASGNSTWDADMINSDAVPQTGRGVYVAVLDTGMVPNWRDYFPEARVATNLGVGFYQAVNFKAGNAGCDTEVEIGPLHQTTWVGSLGSTHGTHVASTILGYFYRSNTDAAQGYPLPPIIVRGIAPDVTVIPVKVLADYHVPARPKCGLAGGDVVFGTDSMVTAGIRYVTSLKRAGYSPMVINMSLGGSTLDAVEQDAIDDAIEAGVIIVASAGNDGEGGMGYPGAYAPVISAGSVGWTKEWLFPDSGLPRYRMWWLQYPSLPAGSGNVPDPTSANDIYVSDFSSRALAGQELDVLAPGSWVRGPFPSDSGYNHLPWWSRGIGDLRSGRLGNFFYVGGTSMASPHVASIAALMLQKDPSLTQSLIETKLKASALPIPAIGTQLVFDFDHFANISWDTDCGGNPCDAVGAGVIQATAALALVP